MTKQPMKGYGTVQRGVDNSVAKGEEKVFLTKRLGHVGCMQEVRANYIACMKGKMRKAEDGEGAISS